MLIGLYYKHIDMMNAQKLSESRQEMIQEEFDVPITEIDLNKKIKRCDCSIELIQLIRQTENTIFHDWLKLEAADPNSLFYTETTQIIGGRSPLTSNRTFNNANAFCKKVGESSWVITHMWYGDIEKAYNECNDEYTKEQMKELFDF